MATHKDLRVQRAIYEAWLRRAEAKGQVKQAWRLRRLLHMCSGWIGWLTTQQNRAEDRARREEQ